MEPLGGVSLAYGYDADVYMNLWYFDFLFCIAGGRAFGYMIYHVVSEGSITRFFASLTKISIIHERHCASKASHMVSSSGLPPAKAHRPAPRLTGRWTVTKPRWVYY
jgi:hypothetical protein